MLGTTRGLLVAGAPGVGRSRVLVEIAGILDGRPDTTVTQITGSAAAADIALGALAAIEPEHPTGVVGDRIRHVAAVLHRRARPGLPVLVVDDAHLLDDATLALIHALVTSGNGRVVVAVRRDFPVPATLAALSKDRLLRRLDLPPLDRADADALLAAAFPGHLPEQMVDELWQVTAGHPLHLRLVTDAAIKARTLVEEDNGWRWDGWPTDAPELVDLVADRTAGATADALVALEVLAVAGPLPETVAGRVLDAEAWRTVERLALTSATDGGDVCIAQPLVAAVVAAGLGPGTRRAHARTLAEAWGTGDDDRARLQAARWRLAAGADLEPETAIAGARLALGVYDIELGERLAMAAVRARPSVDAHLVLADALRAEARGREAVDELDRAATMVVDDDERARIATARAETVAFLLHDLDSALVVLREAADEITDPEAARKVALQRTFLGAFAGDFRQVVAAADLSLAGVANEDAELDVILATTFAQALSVQLDDIDARLDRGGELAAERAVQDPFARQKLVVCRTLAMLGHGLVGRAFDMASAELAAALDGDAPTGFAGICAAFAGCFTGDLTAATDAAVEAARSVRGVDPLGVAGLAASLGALAALQSGRPETARRLLDGAGPRVGADERARAVMAERTSAWWAVMGGSVDEGATIAAGAGTAAVAASHCLWGAGALHDAVRLGRADLVRDDLAALADECRSPLIDTFVRHAEALDAGDALGLMGVRDRFAAHGCRLFAAETEAQAAVIAAAAGDETQGARLATRARIRWSTCTGSEPVAIRAAPPGLTPRPQQIAVLASTGATSKEIADQLYLSARTVDNHLRQAYAVLGVSGREELARVLVE